MTADLWPALRQRQAAHLAAMEARRARGWEIARRAAALLRQRGASRVVLFGSLARGEPLSWRSDIDLAAWGLPAKVYFRTVAHLQDLDPDFAVDLVRGEDAPPRLLAAIAADGVDL